MRALPQGQCPKLSSRELLYWRAADIVEDAYDRILEYERQGLLKNNQFENLSEEQLRRDRNMIIGCIRRFGLLKKEKPMSAFVRERFPPYWEEAARADDRFLENV